MSARTWTVRTLLITLVAGACGVLANLWLDVYGLFRESRGRELAIYNDSERSAKYLLNRHYVPRNFEALLLGSSVTANWQTSGISAFRTYNESVDGANIAEQALLAERALASPGIAVVLCLIHPFLTDTHGLTSEEMSEAEHWGALGSISLYRSYKPLLLEWLGVRGTRWNADGSEDVLAPLEMGPTLRRVMVPVGEFVVDEVAFEEYRALTRALRGRGIALVGVVPPTAEALLAPKRAAMDRYVARVRGLFSGDELVVDFNGPEYLSFRAYAGNYQDGVHLSAAGARKVVAMLDQRLLATKATSAGTPKP